MSQPTVYVFERLVHEVEDPCQKMKILGTHLEKLKNAYCEKGNQADIKRCASDLLIQLQECEIKLSSEGKLFLEKLKKEGVTLVPVTQKTQNLSSTASMAQPTVYVFGYLVHEVQDPCQKMKILGTHLEKLKNAYHKKGQDLKRSAGDLQNQLRESGIKLSQEGELFLEKLKTECSVNKMDITSLQVKQDNTEPVSIQSVTEAGIDLKPNPSTSSPTTRPKHQSLREIGHKPQELMGKQGFSKTLGSTASGNGQVSQKDVERKDQQNQNQKMENIEEEHKQFKEKSKKFEDECKKLNAENKRLNEIIQNKNKSLEDQQHGYENIMDKQIQDFEQKEAQLIAERDDLKVKTKELLKKVKALEERANRQSREDAAKYDTLKMELQELKNRFSKVAGAKLQDGNPDITDLSDPNRAMKLETKFSAIYDDEWTDAFQAQTDVLKRSTKDAIETLLTVLKSCYDFCKDVAGQQMDSLRIVFLHPCQDLCTTAMAQKDRPRIPSKEDKILKDLRKQIGTQSINEVKQQFLAQMAKSYKTEEGKKVMGESKSYFEKCAEVCWMMVLHDPPLYMDTSIKTGDKINLNFYRVYSSQGENADFLVWPPLHITGGGLLAKGVVEPISKKKK